MAITYPIIEVEVLKQRKEVDANFKETKTYKRIGRVKKSGMVFSRGVCRQAHMDMGLVHVSMTS